MILRPHAQCTVRLHNALQQLGLALGGKAGVRLSRHLGLPTSPDSLLRLVRQAEHPTKSSAKTIGIDDWANRRGLRYGTLICDLEGIAAFGALRWKHSRRAEHALRVSRPIIAHPIPGVLATHAKSQEK